MTDIRRAQRDDAARLTEIAHAAKRHWGYDEKQIAAWGDELTVTGGYIESFPVFCAVPFGEVAGFYAIDHQFELDYMYVDPSFMGNGIGRALFEHAKAQVAQAGGNLLIIKSDPHAEGFFLRLGAELTGSIPSRIEGRRLPLFSVTIDTYAEHYF